MAFRKVNSRKLKQADSIQETAIKLHKKGEWNKALEFYEKSLEIFQNLEIRKEFQVLTITSGLCTRIKGNGIKHWNFTKKAWKYFKELGNKQGNFKFLW